MNVQGIIIKIFRARLQLLAAVSKKRAGNEAFRIFCTPYFRMAYKGNQFENAERLSFKSGTINTVGYRWNKGGDKKLLIVHGFRSAAANFLHFVDPLIEKGYEIVAFDAPAHGLSEGKSLNAIEYKDFIASLHQQFGPFDAFLCHSFGGLAVSMNLAELPENSNIKTVLIAPAANSRQLIEFFFKEMHIKDKLVKEHFYANIQRLSGKNIEWFSIARCAGSIQGPVLWIHDKDDAVTPVQDAFDIQQTQPTNFHFLFTSNLGHRRIYRDKEVVVALINFL
ncbi:alpha/beta hydrolase [Niabella yanshanensis]|uniref:Alpha/beta hydrolase n=1 Tax=Niabella yanshanensis TaxID=577386 RepID=A0ABZ0W813_9BACT|nr:alpha/beta hydrolase [Niabella yanshanensis]WQD39336.1 alpha/beta hydrolase [Niabella yanshanensis]